MIIMEEVKFTKKEIKVETVNKDWVGDSNSIFKQLGASSHTDKEREENDYYATDPKAIDDLFKQEEFSDYIWECASGGGHLVRAMLDYGKKVYSTDLIDRGWQNKIVDFLKCDKPYNGDIITNPPYKYCTEFILKALELTGNKVAMFLKLQTLEGQDRYKKIFKDYPPKTIYVYSKRIQCGKNGVFEGSSAVCYAWFVWEKNVKTDPVIKWII